MMKAEQVPNEVVKAALLTDERLGMREIIAAAINAWPGMHEVDHRMTASDEMVSFGVVLPVILPLPQEARDA